MEEEDEEGEDEINVLAPDSPIIKYPVIFSSALLGAAFILGSVLYYAFCKRRWKGISKNDSGRTTVLFVLCYVYILQ